MREGEWIKIENKWTYVDYHFTGVVEFVGANQWKWELLRDNAGVAGGHARTRGECQQTIARHIRNLKRAPVKTP